MLDSFLLQCLPAWSLDQFFQGGVRDLQRVAAHGFQVGGLILLIVGGVMAIKKLVSKGGQSASWVQIVVMLILGAALLVGGFAVITNLGVGLQTSVGELGGSGVLTGGNAIDPLSTIVFDGGMWSCLAP